MKRLFPILLCVFFLTGCTSKECVIQGFSMDASYQIKAQELSKEQEADVKEFLHGIDSIMNAYQEDSLISQLNHSKKLTVADSDEKILLDFVQKTLAFCNESFDISIRPVSKLWDFKTDNPSLPDEATITENLKRVGYQNIIVSHNGIQLKNDAEIEPGAAAKGYVCDQVANMLSGKIALIDIGGTVKTIGKDCVVGVKSPNHDGLLCSFTLTDGKSVSTSGSYERSFVIENQVYHHILNPKTGYPAETDFVSVTVISDSAQEADILSTTLFLQNMLQIPESAEVIYVTKDGLVYYSSGIQNFQLCNQTYHLKTLEKE